MRWIAARSVSCRCARGDPFRAMFTLATTFKIPSAYDPSQSWLYLRAAVDNWVTVRLNGHDLCFE